MCHERTYPRRASTRAQDANNGTRRGFTRHGTGLNVGFWDGHALFLSEEEFRSDPVIDGHGYFPVPP